MGRPNRGYKTEFTELEGRMLLSRGIVGIPGPILTTPNYPPAYFSTSMTLSDGTSMKIVTQNSGRAELALTRTDDNSKTTQVRLKSDDSPVVGVNIPPIDQVVTFEKGQNQATVTIPIIPGAPSPGEVDVRLTLKPVDPSDPSYSGNTSRFSLHILGSDSSLPPKVVESTSNSDGIVLYFNKPMDPASASDPANYTVNQVTFDHHRTAGLFGLFFQSNHDSVSGRTLKIESARYDPATQSVTISPAARKQASTFGWVTDTTVKVIIGPKAPAGPRHRKDAPKGLMDTHGVPINSDTTPGRVRIRLSRLTFSGGGGFA